MESDHDFLFKIVIIGDSSVGKTSVLLRYVQNVFYPEFATTIGVDFKITQLELEGKIIKLQLWDTAGQDRYRNIVSTYYRGSQGLIVMFDLTNEESFLNVKKWATEWSQYLLPEVPKLLIGNKLDLADKRVISRADAEAEAERLGVKYIETSAKENLSLGEAMESIARQILRSVQKNQLNTKKAAPETLRGTPVKRNCCSN